MPGRKKQICLLYARYVCVSDNGLALAHIVVLHSVCYGRWVLPSVLNSSTLVLKFMFKVGLPVGSAVNPTNLPTPFSNQKRPFRRECQPTVEGSFFLLSYWCCWCCSIMPILIFQQLADFEHRLIVFVASAVPKLNKYRLNSRVIAFASYLAHLPPYGFSSCKQGRPRAT